MARGWESKWVEQQQEEAKSNQGSKREPSSEQQIAQAQKRKGLELSRSRVLDQLNRAANPRHRQMLEAALAELERQLRAISIR
jgi:hypothetical protein